MPLKKIILSKEMPKEECGVAAIYSEKENISNALYLAMMGVQHRGELGCGMAVLNESEINAHKDIGLVSDVFQPSILSNLKGSKGLGHTRYATSSKGFETKEYAIKKLQPMIGESKLEKFAIAFNGTLTNYNTLRRNLSNHCFETYTDTEVIKNLIINERENDKSLEQALKNSYEKMQGAYSLIALDSKGIIYALRDGHGFKPLSIGNLQNNEGYIICSETRGMDFINAEFKRDILPGELVKIENNEIISHQLTPKKKSLCVFEYVYFASIDSIIEGVTVNDARVRLGKQLLKESPLSIPENEKDDWRIIGVPDTGMPSATAYSNESGIKIRIGMSRNRYYQTRTFINGDVEQRKKAANLNSQKYAIVPSAIKGKNIILIDDSLVRGTTTKNNIARLKKAGAKQVHVKLTFPPITSPCYMGTDFPTHAELIAHDKSLEELCREIGADSVQFISIKGLISAIKGSKKKTKIDYANHGLCLACINNDYSCPVEDELKTN
ncbi:MAG: amidophosphoribosyltransferase [Candidatus Nanoarchaeia archaeon]|nr:amidophosphoribosyltransferase [Candidatus Nanoarchaeia archaeon]